MHLEIRVNTTFVANTCLGFPETGTDRFFRLQKMKFSDVLIKTLRGEQGKTDLKTPRIVRNAHYSFVGNSNFPHFMYIHVR